MTTNRSARNAYTLIELIASVGIAGVLTAGLSSSLFVALRATDTASSPAAGTSRGLAALSEMAGELEYAQSVSEQMPTAITVTVPDRLDADTIAETIRYAWSGIAGDPLTRQYNLGAVAAFVDSVEDFDIQYFQPSANLEYVTLRIQTSVNSVSSVETSVPLLNQP